MKANPFHCQSYPVQKFQWEEDWPTLWNNGKNSRIFLVPNKNGKLRPVIDLSLLNRYIKKQSFKMETVKSVRQSIMNNDWAVSIDLTDAYCHVPRKYLRFIHEDKIFQFTDLPFRMSLSLWIFTKLMDVIAAHIHYSSGKRTKKVFTPNIGVLRTSLKHSESNRVNVIFGGHHSQVRRKYALCEVTRNGNIVPGGNISCEIPRSNSTKYLSDF